MTSRTTAANCTRRAWLVRAARFSVLGCGATAAFGQTARQPKVAPGPHEPDWVKILDERYGLSMFGDLANPVAGAVEAVPGLFRKAGAGPVKYEPLLALGLETITRGGWYAAAAEHASIRKIELWSYQHKHTTRDLATNGRISPPLLEGSKTTFDPGDGPFGLWVSNDGLKEAGAFSEPLANRALTPRFAQQPYKAMIYPYKSRRDGPVVPHAYLIGWEYSTNDDFQDVVCLLENVALVKS